MLAGKIFNLIRHCHNTYTKEVLPGYLKYIEDLKKAADEEPTPILSYNLIQAEDRKLNLQEELKELKALKKIAVEGEVEQVEVPKVEELVKEEEI